MVQQKYIEWQTRKKNKSLQHVASKRPILRQRKHIDWKRGDGKRYFMQMKMIKKKRSQYSDKINLKTRWVLASAAHILKLEWNRKLAWLLHKMTMNYEFVKTSVFFAQEEGDICIPIPMADSCWCMAETNSIF